MEPLGLPIKLTLPTLLLRVPSHRMEQVEACVLREVRTLPEVGIPILRAAALARADHPVVVTAEVAIVEDHRRVLLRQATAPVDLECRAVRRLDHPRLALRMQAEAERKIDRAAAHQLPLGQAKLAPEFFGPRE
jgi:hypothetical protein